MDNSHMLFRTGIFLDIGGNQSHTVFIHHMSLKQFIPKNKQTKINVYSILTIYHVGETFRQIVKEFYKLYINGTLGP